MTEEQIRPILESHGITDFAADIRAMRIRKALSLPIICRILGMDVVTLNRWEMRRATPPCNLQVLYYEWLKSVTPAQAAEWLENPELNGKRRPHPWKRKGAGPEGDEETE